MTKSRKPVPPQRPIEPPPPDPVGEALVAAGLVPNVYVLDLNHGLTAPPESRIAAPWSLPSRMFKFPIEVSAPPSRRMGLLHPLLAAHPFVARVQDVLGCTLGQDGAPNEAGYTKTGLAGWWHAVDLIGTHWRDLLATREYTTDDCIAGAVAHGLQYAGKSGFGLREAHQVLGAVGAARPADPLGGLWQPSPCGPHWPVNTVHKISAAARAWAIVSGIESGWLRRDRSGQFGWSDAGRAAYARQTEPVLPAVPDHEPAARPTQLNLF